MKKKIFISLGIVGITIAIFASGVFAASDIKLFINGNAVNSDIQVINGSSYVPLRVVSESLGAIVKWDGVARTISITSGTPAATPSPINSPKSYAVNVNVESGPMKMNISKVTLDPAYQKSAYYPTVNAIIMDVTVENTSTDTVSWYTDQGTAVLNTKEQADADTFNSDQVGGDFIGNVVKSGKIVITVKSDLTQISSITYKIDGPHNANYDRVGDDKTTEIILK